jgi:hypothetical protein
MRTALNQACCKISHSAASFPEVGGMDKAVGFIEWDKRR